MAVRADPRGEWVDADRSDLRRVRIDQSRTTRAIAALKGVRVDRSLADKRRQDQIGATLDLRQPISGEGSTRSGVVPQVMFDRRGTRNVDAHLLPKGVNMADPTKLSVEKALQKIREGDALKSKSSGLDEETDALNEEIRRMRAQRLRLERRQRKRD